MKHLYIFLSCFLFLQINFSFAQTNVYQPFPNDSAVWYYQFQNTPSSQYYLKELLGDTMINALTYKKEYYQQWNPNINFHYIGGIRQDIPNEKIYYINLSGVEHDISVNQHLMVGDIFPGGNDTIVSIDSVLVGTKYHKQYNYRDSTNSAFYVKGSYIVGVGTSGWGGPESDTILWCFSVNNVLLYHLPPSPSLCPSLLLSVNEEKINENYIFISPNPTNGKFTIQMDNGQLSIKNYQLSIYNVLGEKVFHSVISNPQSIIDISPHPSGIYFLKMDAAGKEFTKKLVKE